MLLAQRPVTRVQEKGRTACCGAQRDRDAEKERGTRREGMTAFFGRLSRVSLSTLVRFRSLHQVCVPQRHLSHPGPNIGTYLLCRTRRTYYCRSLYQTRARPALPHNPVSAARRATLTAYTTQACCMQLQHANTPTAALRKRVRRGEKQQSEAAPLSSPVWGGGGSAGAGDVGHRHELYHLACGCCTM